MKLVFYSIVLNHHQACVSDEFYKLLGNDYAFVETMECSDQKGAMTDYSKRPYLVKAWESEEAYQRSMNYALKAEVCVFGGYDALPFETARMKMGLLSFDMGERWLKRGLLNLLSPRIFQMFLSYHLGGWSKKPLYKLCMSAFTAGDQNRLYTYKDKCYKWGYFTHVDEDFDIEASLMDASTSEITSLMWCSRFLRWKHPELPVKLAAKLKAKGYKFVIDMYGDEGNAAKYDGVYSRKQLEALIVKLGVQDCVHLMGNRPNNEILDAMRSHMIFLFTSDHLEGWGAVANESMSNGCVLIASDAIGSSPYLIKDGENGFMFRSCDANSLIRKVEWLFNHPQDMASMRRNAYEHMKAMWSPKVAAERLLVLISDLQQQKDSSFEEGPCSKA